MRVKVNPNYYPRIVEWCSSERFAEVKMSSDLIAVTSEALSAKIWPMRVDCQKGDPPVSSWARRRKDRS